MKKPIFTLFTLLYFISSITAQNTWTQKPDFPGTARYNNIGFAYDSNADGVKDKGITGFGTPTSKDYWRYDPATGDWDSVGISPISANRGFMLTEVDNKFYFCGGEPMNDELWEYDPVIDSWTLKSNFPLGNVKNGVAFTIDSIAYFGGGRTDTGNINDFFSYDPFSNSWDTISQLGTFLSNGLNRGVSADTDKDGKFDRAFLGFGNTSDKFIYEYIPSLDTLFKLTSFPGSINYSPIINYHNDRLYTSSMESVSFSGANAEFWEYNLTTNIWTQKTSPTVSASVNNEFIVKPGTLILGDSLYYVCGASAIQTFGAPIYSRLKELWVYNLPASIDSPNTISGNIYLDRDSSCSYNSADSLMRGWIVKAEPGPYYAMSKFDGSYTLQVPDGQYDISLIPPSLLEDKIDTSVCPIQSYPLQFNTLNNDTSGFDFGVVLELCYNLQVQISSNFRRRCFTNQTVLSYSNIGMIKADSAYVRLKYPEHLTIVNANTNYAVDSNGYYIFYLGTLGAQQSGTINITDSVNCGNIGILGLTQCVEASIYPKSNCTLSNSWNGSEVDVEATCDSAGVVFTVSNSTGVDMTDSVEYRLFSDSLLIATGKLQLNANKNLSIQVPATGATFRLEIDQVADHPYNSMVNAVVEACGNNAQNISLGYVNQFYQADEDISVDVECLPIIGSYDPNDKLVSPEGIGQQKLTYPDSRLEYTIRFQNTGTDTAFKVVVVDTLSELIDLSTLRLGPASHTYEYDLSGRDTAILTFTFNNILLPDSNTNYDASNGFVRFSAKPLPNQIGATVKNKASIYFDANPPIQTNTTINLLGYPNLTSTSISDSIIICSTKFSDTLSFTSCNQFISPDGRMLDNSGFYMDTIQNALGCDSIVPFHLIINSETYGSEVVNTCNSYISASGKVFDSTGIYSDTVSNTLSCDSIITIDLTILENSTSTQQVNSCGSYTAPSGSIWESSTVFNDTIPNQAGCDSIITIDLTITEIETAVVQEDLMLIATMAGDNYQWLDCENNYQAIAGEISDSFTATKNGSYAVEITKNNCVDTSQCFSVNSVGMLEKDYLNEAHVFPNPTSGDVNIDFGKIYSSARVTVFSITGQNMQQIEFSNEQRVVLDINQPEGIYFIEVVLEMDKRIMVKVVKQ